MDGSNDVRNLNAVRNPKPTYASVVAADAPAGSNANHRREMEKQDRMKKVSRLESWRRICFYNNGAFYDCASIRFIRVSTNLEHIGEEAFCDCYSLGLQHEDVGIVNG